MKTIIDKTPYKQIASKQPIATSEYLPMFNIRKVFGIFAIVLSALVLSACGGGSDIESGTNQLLTCDVPNVPDPTGSTCVPPPPIVCPAPTVPNETNDACVVGADPTLPPPVFFPGEDQAVLYYNRLTAGADNSPNDSSYEGWRLHTWSNDECDAYADSDTEWANGRVHTGIDPNYGAYWVLDLKPGYANTPGACHNFIVHIGTDDAGKDLGGIDQKGSLTQDDPTFTRMNFTLTGETTIFEYPIISLGPQPVKIEGMAAHWLDTNTIMWNPVSDAVESVKLHYSANADLEASLESGLNGTAVDLESVVLTDEQAEIAPHLSSMQAFAGEWEAADAKAVMKGMAVLGGYNAEGTLVEATGIQLANGLDQLYTVGEDDANEAQLGAVYADGQITLSVWAPTAQSVNLLRYSEAKTLSTSIAMTEDPNTGIWSYTAPEAELDRTLYRYEVTVYHPVSGNIEVLEVTDPYSVSLSTNGRFSRFVDLSDEDLKPEGWDTHEIPTIEYFEDAVIYEGHIRDFSIRDESVSPANRGKYLAFTEEGSVPVEYLRSLVEAGVTHFHMLPANDIATIEEDVSKTVDFDSTVGELCLLNRSASVCGVEDDNIKLGDLFTSYNAVQEPTKAQALAQDMRNVDQFNWGYDPHHFNAPEGSYSSDPEGIARIKEMRAMNQALHEMGLRVALDVVYNHTNASGLFPKSVLDKVVPGYYHRYEVDSGAIVRETCCDDTEPRNAMFEKFMEDSLVMWTKEYKFDSFRFDIMSQATKDTMVRLEEVIQAIDPDNYFYGEGWIKQDRGYEQATQANMAGTEIGTFNDRIREAVRQGQIFKREADNGLFDAQDRVKMSMAGTLSNYVLETFTGTAVEASALGGYAQDPADIINYVSKHDNESLWDQFNYVLPSDLSLEERVRAQNIGMNLTVMSQGIPFLQMGGELLRSKSMDRNSYDSGDWFNFVDFTKNTNNWNIGLPLASDNQNRWDQLATFIYAPERAASMSEIEFAGEVFKEFVSIRQSSRLFKLTTGQDIIERVGFHNIGDRQQAGLIVMSIDDGINADLETQLADLDPRYDAVAIVVNSGYEEKSIEVRTAAGFELHMTQQMSVDPTVRGASFTEAADGQEGGTFTVPALTMAVFVKPQGSERAYGLSAYATAGAPDVVPYGDETVFLRGSMNDWGESSAFEYKGEGIYEVSYELSAGVDYAFKVASSDWSTVNLGNDADPIVIEDEEKTLVPGANNNLMFMPNADATYIFTLDARDTSAPILRVVNEEPFVGTPVYLRGGMTGWGTSQEFEYQGGRIYTTTLDIEASSEPYFFKVASEDWATVNMGALSSEPLDVEVKLGQNQALLQGSNDNLSIQIDETAGYAFIFDVTTLSEPKVRVFAEEFFGSNTVYIRGGMNGWGEVDALEYAGAGSYSIDIELDGSEVQFKVATGDWSTVNLGAENADSAVVDLGVEKPLFSTNDNLILPAGEAGLYEFKVTGPDASAPTVTVIKKD